MKNYYETNL